MPNVVFDASSLVGALLKEGSTPERALLLARARLTICMSAEVEGEITEVVSRPKFAKLVTPQRVSLFLAVVMASAAFIEPIMPVTDCRDPKDNKYLALALACRASWLVSSDNDLLVLNPWRGTQIVTPAEFLELL